ncbi:MAG: hypothetical protein GWO87_00115 [Xanthomonadaceae bacterium]|nr:hypothetical protein [Rhodospirillaceae bacterium]NIA17585.1 hypothetical protein [Xanthomonadaceae bacterium]
MTFLGKIIFGSIGALIGFLLIKYSNSIRQNFGAIYSAEKYFGSFGGTRLMWKLIGFLIIFLSFLLMTGLLGKFMETILSPFIPS